MRNINSKNINDEAELPEGRLEAKTQNSRMYRVLDMVNTHDCARELVDHRVAQVNRSGRYVNDIYCGSGEYVQMLREKGHTVHVIDTPRSLSPVRLIVAMWKTFNLLRRYRFDIIHVHTPIVAGISRIAALFARTPFIVNQVHGYYQHDGMHFFKRWVLVKVEQILSLWTDKLLFQHKADIQECLDRRIAPEHKLVLIGNGVQLESFEVGEEKSSDPPIILYVSRLEHAKNHTMLFEAARILKSRNILFQILLAGEGDLRERHERWVRDNGLEKDIVFLGYRNDVPKLLGKASICVLTSFREGLPRGIIEAAAAGRPMVATNVRGSRDALVDGVTGFFVPLNDTVALADRLEQLLLDAKLRRRIGQQARAYAREQFDEKKVTDRIIAVYDELTNS